MKNLKYQDLIEAYEAEDKGKFETLVYEASQLPLEDFLVFSEDLECVKPEVSWAFDEVLRSMM